MNMSPLKDRPKPKAFEPEDIEQFWRPEPWDKFLPTRGFITDFVTSLRGVETPTQIAAWTAAFLLSSAMKRESYYKLHPATLYPNLFVVIVGPPRLVAKSTAVGYGEGYVLSKFHEFMPTDELKLLKRTNVLRSRATPEALTMALQPDVEAVYNKTRGKLVQVDRGSQLAIVVSELATFLGKQKYNMGLVDKLTHLYDCKDVDDDLTIARGKMQMRNVYVTFFGATTRDGLENSIPPEAFGSGFMSRLILVYENKPTRSFSIPIEVTAKDGEAIDWKEELPRRMAWIAENSMGEYVLEKKAKEFYEDWYGSFRKRLERTIESRETQLQTRFDNHLIKLAMIIRAQRYEIGRVITYEDMQDAYRMLRATYDRNFSSVEDAGVGSPWGKWYNVVVRKLRDVGKMERKLFTSYMSGYHCKVVDFDSIIKQLLQEGKIKIIRKGKEVKNYSSDGKEVYEWVTKQTIKLED